MEITKMNLKKLSIIIGITLLSGVLASFVFGETKYYYMSKEITEHEYKEIKDVFFPGMVTIKKVNNYEVGILTAISVFSGLLVLNGLIKNKKSVSEN
jgi:hypothetical protein